MIQERSPLPVGATVWDMQNKAYIVEGILGQGGFSSVYLVKDQFTKQHVFALKELINPSPQEKINLRFEAKVLMRLSHPSLPHIYEVFENTTRNRTYLLMDYIAGRDLEILRQGQTNKCYSLVAVILLMSPIAEAVNYLHSQTPPIVHRDIKPANIIVPNETRDAFLVDFSLAKEYIQDKTTNIFRYGTPGYAAPEQYGQGTSLRTDVYGFAATTYTLLTGIVPIDAIIRSVNKQGSDPLKRADLVNPIIPAAIGKILERALSLQPEGRYATVDEFWKHFVMATEMHAVGGADTINTLPLSTTPSLSLPKSLATPLPAQPIAEAPQSPVRKSRRRTLPIISFVVLTLLLLGAAIGSLFWFGPWSTHVTHPVASKKNHPLAATPINACIPSNTLPPNTNYPQIVPCYGGTINDLGVAHGSNAMYLTGVKQVQNTISGRFQGLGFVGALKGNVNQDGNIQFVVSLPGRADTITFTGSIKYGGDLTGSFKTLDKNGQPTPDEYGVWYVQPRQ